MADAESVAALRGQDVEHLKREAAVAAREQERRQAQVDSLEAALAAAKEKKRALVESMGTEHKRAQNALSQRVDEEIAKVERRTREEQETVKAHLREIAKVERRTREEQET